MADVLLELEHNLIAKKEKLTYEELMTLYTCKSKSLRNFSVGAAAGSFLVWAATSRLNKMLRVSLSGGAACFLGLWTLARSVDSCVENILSLEGSQIQNELAKIIVKKYHHDPGRMQAISKHFYAEQVFDDSASDQPKLRWRYRNFFSDGAASIQRIRLTDYQHGSDDQPHDGDKSPRNDAQANPQNKSNGWSVDFHSESDIKGAAKLKMESMDLGVDTMGDPLDSVFGVTSMKEEIHHSGNKSEQNRASTHSHRKSRRRHRMRQREAAADVLHPHAV